MTAKKCDRCNKYYDYYEGTNGMALMHYDDVNDTDEMTVGLDLCPECLGKLKNWLDGGDDIEK